MNLQDAKSSSATGTARCRTYFGTHFCLSVRAYGDGKFTGKRSGEANAVEFELSVEDVKELLSRKRDWVPV